MTIADPQARFEGMLQKLRERGCRITRQRVALLHLLAASEKHPSAAVLYDQLRAQFPAASLATVYKTLTLLEDMGEVLELAFSHDDRRYDGNQPYPHPHLICIRCHEIVDLQAAAAESLTQEATERSGFRVLGHRLDVYGLCPQCQSVEPNGGPIPGPVSGRCGQGITACSEEDAR